MSDSDWMFQKFKTHVDSIGSRDVQLAMFVEVKTHNGEPNDAQAEILFYHHQLLKKKKKVKRILRTDISLWHCGVFILKLPGERPDDHRFVHWGQFREDGTIQYVRGTSGGLHKILRFDIYPDTFKPISLRRHHKTQEIVMTEKTPLGFEVEKKVKFSS